jgi:lipopolysaccharide/colanic/teichoic acid biosynthesis glycosyltransferase
VLFPDVKADNLGSADIADKSWLWGAPAGGIYRRCLKRAFDLGVVLLAAPFVLLVVGVLALLIRRDGGPAFYSQNRVASDGRTFRCWKLRSMVVDAEAQLAAYVDSCPVAHAEWSTHQKLRNDPRVTRIGRVIRKTSLDELPQLWNVLVGDMSLVGPRPMLPEQIDLYKEPPYFGLRPGLTGLWQARHRNNSSFADRARFDREYRDDLSFGTDLLLLIQTAWVVLRGTGW